MSQTHGESSAAQPQPPSSGLHAAAGRLVLPGLTFLDLAISLGLILSVFAVYAQVGLFDFISYDDDLYVAANPHVQAGLTFAGIKWALTAVVSSNWLPVTLLSHMLDVQLFGLQSGMHHLVNVLIHALAAVLLFVVFKRATGEPGPSAFVAFVFALHPLHVESVAWISERKDVLSAFFWFLTLYCYVRYAEKPGLGRYLVTLVPFCLGLMSKPMVVTLPFTLLLFDLWPLRRVQWPGVSWLRILWEKVPLVVLSAGVSLMTYWIQKSTRAASMVIALQGRIGKALISYITYIRQTFWPTHLAVFYPYPRYLLAWEIAAAFLFILTMSAITILVWRTRPYLAVGWFWYLGTLVPVIGLVQAGQQSHADRYSYIPMVGLLVMVAWGATDVVDQWVGNWPRIQPVIATAGVVSCTVCLVLAWQQTANWRNADTLFQHAIDVTGDNWVAQGSLGQYLMKIPERRADAIEHLETAIRIQPNFAEAHNNLGLVLARVDLCGAAIPHFQAALLAKPDLVEASNNLGMCLMNSGRYGEAITYFESALRARPDYSDPHFNLGLTFSKLTGRNQEAVAQYEAGLRLEPANAEAHRNLGMLLVSLGRTREALAHLEAAQQLRPDPETAMTIDSLRAGR